MSFNKHSFQPGQTVQIKVSGEVVDAKYVSWHDEYNMAICDYKGRRVYRKVHASNGVQATKQVSEMKPSRFDINQRFEFIEDVCDMVITGESKAVIVSGSGGLGKTFTVTKCLKDAGLADSQDEDEEGADFTVVKGYTTPKSLYRLLYENRERILIFDDCDSVWDNPTCVSLLKAALDSYETRRIGWHSEIRGDAEDDLPQSFLFEGKVIFVSNLSLSQLDQAVLSRCLYVDVSMTPEEKIARIKKIMPSIDPNCPMATKQDALDLLSKLADQVGDLNIRTFLKVLEIRKKNAANWKDLAEYVVTAF